MWMQEYCIDMGLTLHRKPQKLTVMKKITYGDKIYARLVLNGNKVVEIILDDIATMTDLIGEVRALTLKLRGLAKLYIRNMTQGWSMERPLMLYTGKFGSVA